jgi:hypothetical protein
LGARNETIAQEVSMGTVANTSTRFDQWMKVATLALIAGASAWLVKLVVIVITDGADSGAADAATAVFFLLGFVLLLGGSSAVGLWLTRGRGPVVRIAAALLAPVTFLVSWQLLDPVGQALVGDLGPNYVREESAIWLNALLWLALGVLVAAGSRPRRLPVKS